jgi:uncharacterized membrane protein
MTTYVLHPVRRDVTRPSPWRHTALVALVVAYTAAGLLHLTVPKPFIAITPSWVPWPEQVIQFTGLCELAGAAGLLIPGTRKLAGLMLAIYAVCVFPANIKHAFWLTGPDASPWRWLYHAPRLALQPVIVWWPLWVSNITDWPFGNKRGAERK